MARHYREDSHGFSYIRPGGRPLPGADGYRGIPARRALAYLIDVLILMLVGVIVLLLKILSFGLLAPLLSVLMLALPLVYHSLTVAAVRGATPGQRAMGLRVVREADGGPVTFPRALLLTFLFYATLALTGGLLLLWCLFDRRGRCLHDSLCGVLVVYDNP